MTFLATHWAFSQWVGHAAFTACLTLGTLKVGSLPLPFLYLYELISSMTVAVAIPPFDLCQLKSFTIILCSLACWRGLDMWCPLSSTLIWPTSWLQNVWLHEKATLSYVPFSLPLSGTSISWLYPWYIGQAGQLTCVLLVWCHCTSHCVVPVRCRHF